MKSYEIKFMFGTSTGDGKFISNKDTEYVETHTAESLTKVLTEMANADRANFTEKDIQSMLNKGFTAVVVDSDARIFLMPPPKQVGMLRVRK